MATEQDKALAALKDAIQMEIDGKEFYLKASRASHNELGKKLMESLAAEEDIHRKVFEDIYDSIAAKKAWPKTDFKPDGGSGLRTVFMRATETMDTGVNALPTELEAVEAAMKMENKSYDYYMGQVKKAAYDGEREFYQALAVQEGEHHRILLDYFEFLKNPEAWFVEKEHPSLDGG